MYWPITPSTLKLAGTAGVLAAAFWFGWEWRDRAADTELLLKDAEAADLQLQAQTAATKASELARELERLTQDRIRLAAEAEALRNQEREVVEKIVNREVVRYVSSPAAGRVLLPGEWVRVHDLAAAGAIGLPEAADAAGPPDAIPSPATDSDAIAVVAENYGTCREITAQLEGLQAWVRAAL